MQFKITLRSFKERKKELQAKSDFYPGIYIASVWSPYYEEEVLLFPYQFFKISNIQQNEEDFYVVDLVELSNKSLIDAITIPAKKENIVKKPKDNKINMDEIKKNIENGDK